MAGPREAANALIDELGFARPRDLDVEVIAAVLNAEVRERSLPGCAARIVGVGDRAIISVDPSCGSRRRRFSIAHELGHWIYDRDHVAPGCTAETIEQGGHKNHRERRANLFASELLMPRSMFDEVVRAFPTLAVAKHCGEEFDVSLTAALIRLVELSEHPAILVCTDANGVRKWFVRGAQVPSNMFPVRAAKPAALRSSLPARPGAEASDLLSADSWIDDDSAEEFELSASSIVTSVESTLTLLTWPDGEQIAEWQTRE